MKENNLLPYRRTPDKQSLNLGPLINNTMYNCDNTNTEKKKDQKTRTYNYTINYLVMRGERESRKCKYKRVSGGQENSLKRKDPRSIDIQ